MATTHDGQPSRRSAPYDLGNLTGNSSTTAVVIREVLETVPQQLTRMVTMLVSGTFDTCTVQLEVKGHDATYVATSSGVTAAGMIQAELPIDATVRGTVSSAGGSTDVELSLL